MLEATPALASSCCEVDARDFTLLVEEQKDRLVNYLFRLTGDRSRAEELAQDVFARVFLTVAPATDQLRRARYSLKDDRASCL